MAQSFQIHEKVREKFLFPCVPLEIATKRV